MNNAMVAVTREDANNYCLILTELGMEEEGDPVAEIRRLKSVDDAQHIDARQYPTILECSTAIDDAVAVDIVERVMKVIHPAPLPPLWIAAIRADLEREFGLTEEEK